VKKQKLKKGAVSYIDQLNAKKVWEQRHFYNIVSCCVLFVFYEKYGWRHKRLMRLIQYFNEVTGEQVDLFDENSVAYMQSILRDRCGIYFREADGREMRF